MRRSLRVELENGGEVLSAFHRGKEGGSLTGSGQVIAGGDAVRVPSSSLLNLTIGEILRRMP